MDGGNCLKRWRNNLARQGGDKRVLNDSNYFLSNEFVDQFANEVKSRKGPQIQPRSGEGSDLDSEATSVDSDDERPRVRRSDGDSSGGLETTPQVAPDHPDAAKENAIRDCTKNWKAAQADEKKKMWEMYDETGIFAAVCRHGMMLAIMDMRRSGEL